MSDYLKYQQISNRINSKKEKESDRLISALAEMILAEENNLEEPNKTAPASNKDNTALTILLCFIRDETAVINAPKKVAIVIGSNGIHNVTTTPKT